MGLCNISFVIFSTTPSSIIDLFFDYNPLNPNNGPSKTARNGSRFLSAINSEAANFEMKEDMVKWRGSKAVLTFFLN